MNAPWTGLFQGEGDGRRVAVRVLRKHGEPLLILPKDTRLAAQAMVLYPAQTRFARAARALVRGALAAGIPLPLQHMDLVWSPGSALAGFVAAQAGSAACPSFAILAGNARTAGRRFVILPFAEDGTPAGVIKAGLDSEARALVTAEADFLASASPVNRGLPVLRARLSAGGVEAFCTDYAPGDAPRAATPEQLGGVLGSWIDAARTVSIGDVPAWCAAFAGRTLPPSVAPLGKLHFHPALFHGDFAPWNIKVHPVSGEWQVLDWERGGLVGMPCWDWLHFEIETAIFVRRRSAEAVRAHLERLWHAPAFRDYADRAGVRGQERALTAAYLQYCVEVVKPTEGLEEMKHLAQLIAA